MNERTRLSFIRITRSSSIASISRCIQQAQGAAFKADPTGDSDFAGVHDSVIRRRTRKSLEAVTAANALTMDGLRAKASLVPIMIDDLDGSPLESFHEEFIRAFAADVVRFQQIAAPTDVVFREQDGAHR